MPSTKQSTGEQSVVKKPAAEQFIAEQPPDRNPTTDNPGTEDAPPATTPPHTTTTPHETGTQATVLSDQSLSNQSFSNQSLSNRLLVLMAHTSRYAFRGQARLAQDAGVSRSTISRLLRGRIASPSFALVCAITRALETHMNRRLDPRELIAPGGAYPTPSGCALAGCRGCMPDEAYDDEGELRAEYRGLRPGDWSLAGSPHAQRPRLLETEPLLTTVQQTQPQTINQTRINPATINPAKESR